jgi:hypothetical protein
MPMAATPKPSRSTSVPSGSAKCPRPSTYGVGPVAIRGSFLKSEERMEETEPLLNPALILAGVHSARNIRKSSWRPSSSQSFVGCRCGGALGCARSVDRNKFPIFFGTNRTSVCQGQLIDRCAERSATRRSPRPGYKQNQWIWIGFLGHRKTSGSRLFLNEPEPS